MGNCLLTKLKGAVDNPALPILDYIQVMHTNSTACTIFIAPADGKTITMKYNGTIQTISSPSGETITLQPNVYYNFGPAENISYYSENDIINLSTLSFNGFAGSTKMVSLTSKRNLDLKSLPVSTIWSGLSIVPGHSKSFNKQAFIEWSSQNVLHDLTLVTAAIWTPSEVAAIAPSSPVLNFTIGDGQIAGNLEDFVITRRSLGQTTSDGKTIKFYYNGSNTSLYFNGQKLPEGDTDSQLSWTASTITYNGVTITA